VPNNAHRTGTFSPSIAGSRDFSLILLLFGPISGHQYAYAHEDGGNEPARLFGDHGVPSRRRIIHLACLCDCDCDTAQRAEVGHRNETLVQIHMYPFALIVFFGRDRLYIAFVPESALVFRDGIRRTSHQSPVE